MATAHSSPTASHAAADDASPRERAFMSRLAAWCSGMVVLIGGGTAVGVAAATGSWVDGAVVGGFLSVFIAPALGGLIAGVLFVDKEERTAVAARTARAERPARTTPPPTAAADAPAPELATSQAA